MDFKIAFDSIEHVNIWHSFERKELNPNGKFLGVLILFTLNLKTSKMQERMNIFCILYWLCYLFIYLFIYYNFFFFISFNIFKAFI